MLMESYEISSNEISIVIKSRNVLENEKSENLVLALVAARKMFLNGHPTHVVRMHWQSAKISSNVWCTLI